MTKRYGWASAWIMAAVVFACGANMAAAQSREEKVVADATAVLDEIMVIPAKGIPAAILRDAKGVAIIPNVVKGSFVIGARHGRGVLVTRDAEERWSAPVIVTLTGGNIGWQAGLQSTDVLLVFKTQKSVDGILRGKLTLGADAAAAAGPVGRNAAAATDLQLKSEILSYSRSRGLFLGVSFDGSVLAVDQFATSSLYNAPGQLGATVIPPSVDALVRRIAAHATSAEEAASLVPTPTPAPTRVIAPPRNVAVDESSAIRDQLARTAPELFELLDPQWEAYLALPREVFVGGHPDAEVLNACLRRYEAVIANKQYAALANHPEFQSTYGLLRHYASTRRQEQGVLRLPPPPAPTR